MVCNHLKRSCYGLFQDNTSLFICALTKHHVMKTYHLLN